MHILLANPRGFCAGVERAIAIVERAIEKFGAPIYVRHEVVHNRFVVDDLKAQGAIFVEELDEVPDGGTVIFSAHGVPKAVRAEAERRGLKVFDATCPLVTKVHLEVERHRKAGREVIMIGHRGHPEVEGTMGQWPDGLHLVENVADVEKVGAGGTAIAGSADSMGTAPELAYVTQTTLSVDDAAAIVAALKARFPAIVGPKKDDICYATQNRQDAVKSLAAQCDLVLVVGSRNSSNSNRLREVAENLGVPAHLIDDASQIDPAWLAGKVGAGPSQADASPPLGGSEPGLRAWGGKNFGVGVTAGASAPEVLVEEVVARLVALGAAAVRFQDGAEEAVTFPLPRELQ